MLKKEVTNFVIYNEKDIFYYDENLIQIIWPESQRWTENKTLKYRDKEKVCSFLQKVFSELSFLFRKEGMLDEKLPLSLIIYFNVKSEHLIDMKKKLLVFDCQSYPLEFYENFRRIESLKKDYNHFKLFAHLFYKIMIIFEFLSKFSKKKIVSFYIQKNVKNQIWKFIEEEVAIYFYKNDQLVYMSFFRKFLDSLVDASNLDSNENKAIEFICDYFSEWCQDYEGLDEGDLELKESLESLFFSLKQEGFKNDSKFVSKINKKLEGFMAFNQNLRFFILLLIFRNLDKFIDLKK